ncbi:hypothetical protein EYF80_042414 [Liparis tanakae]|uniref:Uncharacterized protein n=1 Tax=Liparis tanakae TaxID=230148 RepID=A0A4Z2G2C5_9TELE|nr:hypothetical protein EYF80_042414 [Liparis tanakae]
MFVVQLLLQSLQQTPLLVEAPPILLHPLLAGGAARGAHLQGLGPLRVQLDLRLLELSVQAEALLVGLLGEQRGGLALLVQGQGQLGRPALLLLQTKDQLFEVFVLRLERRLQLQPSLEQFTLQLLQQQPVCQRRSISSASLLLPATLTPR